MLLCGALVGTAAGIVLGLAGNPLTLPQLVLALVEGFRRMGLDDGRFLLFFLNGLAIAVVMLLAFAASATLVRPSPRDTGTTTLKQQAHRLRHVLYSGAAVLIAGTAQAAAMHRLPVAYLAEPWSMALESAAQLTAGATGALWSLFLAAIYLTAALILRVRFTEEAEKVLPGAGEKERKQWLAEHGLDLSPVQQLKRVIAVLGPVLSSLPLTGLFEMLAG